MTETPDAISGAMRNKLESRGWMRRALAIGVVLAASVTAEMARAGGVVVAVYSRTSNGYTRVQQADNSYEPEAYAFAPGGRLDGFMADKSIDDLSFYQVAAVIAGSLRTQNYYQTADPRKAKLLIFLSWGTTTGPDELQYSSGLSTLADAFREASNFPTMGGGSPEGTNVNGALRASAGDAMDSALSLLAVANQERDRRNYLNADILGYTIALRDAEFLKPYAPSARDIISDVEENRYFIVLKAYDFQRLWKKHEKVLRWETRYSIRQFGNRFDRELPAMARYAAQYCGQNVGLARRPLPAGRVEIGIPIVVEPPAEK